MKSIVICAATIVAALLLAGCASMHPTVPRRDGTVTGYRHEGFNIVHPESGFVRLLEIDGHAIKNPEAPLYLRPGSHTLVVSCAYSRPGVNVADPSILLTLNIRTGTVYSLYPVATYRQDHQRCQVDVRMQSPSS